MRVLDRPRFDLHRGQALGTVAVLALNHGRIESAGADSGSGRPFGYPANASVSSKQNLEAQIA